MDVPQPAIQPMCQHVAPRSAGWGTGSALGGDAWQSLDSGVRLVLGVHINPPFGGVGRSPAVLRFQFTLRSEPLETKVGRINRRGRGPKGSRPSRTPWSKAPSLRTKLLDFCRQMKNLNR